MPVFWLHFNRFGHKRNDPDVWTIRQCGRNRYARSVQVKVPITTVYRGHGARQPRAYLRGVGRVTIRGTRAVITKDAAQGS